jgi:hypothetical protein
VSAIRRLPVAGLGLLAAVAGLAPSAHAQQTTIASLSRPTPVSAYQGHVAWSTYVPGRGYVLTTNFDPAGKIGAGSFEWPVRARKVPFDVDLGPGPTGAIVAVYSRCRHEPGRRRAFLGNALTQMPEWRSGRGCDLYEYGFSGRERRVAPESTRSASEFLPSVWKGRIAFARVYERRAGRAGKRAHLYLRRGGGSRRLPAGARSTARFCSGKPKRCTRPVEPGPTALDLNGTRLAFGWDSAGGGGPTSAVYVDTPRGRAIVRERLSLVDSGQIQGRELLSPTIASGYAWFALVLYGDSSGNELRRIRLSSPGSKRALERAPLGTRLPTDSYLDPVLATSVDGSQVYYLSSGSGNGLGGEPCSAGCISVPGCSAATPCLLHAAPLPAFTRPG